MRKIGFILLLFVSFFAAAQDSTYTTFKQYTVEGFEGFAECNHEWFTTLLYTNDTIPSDTAFSVRTTTNAKQCTKCGRQYSVISVWTTFLKREDDEEN